MVYIKKSGAAAFLLRDYYKIFSSVLTFAIPGVMVLSVATIKLSVVGKEEMRMKRDYLSRLRRAARWMLLPEDAAEVIADYEDIALGRSDDELLRDIGNPVQAVKLVADRKEYRHWLRAFTVLAVCVLLIPLTLWVSFPHYFYRFTDSLDTRALFWAAGLLLALWYRWKTRKNPAAPVPPALPPLALATLLSTGAMAWWQHRLLAASVAAADAAALWGEFRAQRICWHILVFLFAAMGLYALVRVRTENRRWLALFVLALTAQLAVMMSFLFATRLSIEPDAILFYLAAMERERAIVAAVGVVVAGVCLC